MATIESTFDDGAEGWQSSSNQNTATWHSSGGDPGGYIRAGTKSGDYLVASSEFYGNQKAYYGGTISFDVHASKAGPAASLPVILFGGGYIIEGIGNATLSPGWTHETIQLKGAEWLDAQTDKPASNAELKSVLAGLYSVVLQTNTPSDNLRLGLDNFAFTSKEQSAVHSGAFAAAHLEPHPVFAPMHGMEHVAIA